MIQWFSVPLIFRKIAGNRPISGIFSAFPSVGRKSGEIGKFRLIFGNFRQFSGRSVEQNTTVF
jgi:hypothetical protein